MEARDVVGVRVEEGAKEGEETISSSNDLGKGVTELSDGPNSRLSKQHEYRFLASIAPRVKPSHM